MLVNWVLIIGGALCVLAEVVMGGFAGFDLVLIGSAVAAGGFVGLIAGSPVVGFVAAAVLSLAYIALGRRWVQARLKIRHVATNADAVIGQRALVMQRIADHHPGQGTVKDELWRAAPAQDATGPFEPGADETRQRAAGVTL